MNISLVQILVISSLCALTAFISHMGMAVFHDGVRPIIPEFIEGRMKRAELGSIAFGLSIGFVASVGIAHTVSTGILNPWLLFLPTDILGLMAPKKWLAPIFGGIWGALVVTSLSLVNGLLTSMPVDLIGAMGTLSDPIVSGFALFPLLAIFYQFGKKKGLIATVITLFIRQLIAVKTTLYPESIQIFVGIVLLLGFAIAKDIKSKNENNSTENEEGVFAERIARIRKNVVWLAIAGAVISIAANLHFFAGSEVSIYTMADAMKATDPNVADTLIKQAAFAEFMRSLSFVPLIATTAIATGVYGVAGLTFIYPIAYLSPNWMVAGALGAIMMCIEVFALGLIGKQLEKFPSIRDSSDSIRSAMTTVMEFSLLIGSMMAVIKMGGYTGFFVAASIYFANEAMGRPVMKLAIAPVAAITTGIVLNLLYYIGLFVPVM
ncbi:YhfT family protein [Clostridium butyricum]|uniref:YhfT family protein n=1 Tax=Clostridium butyricum TaxID=1492 RepID=UPI00040BAB7C|nr:YhfT family protein [Clostridium butyricum]